MLKVYKRTIHIGQAEASHGRELSMNTGKVMSGKMKISNWLTITGMIAGAIGHFGVLRVFRCDSDTVRPFRSRGVVAATATKEQYDGSEY